MNTIHNFLSSISAHTSITILAWTFVIICLTIFLFIVNTMIFNIKNYIFIAKTINKNRDWLDFVINTSVNTERFIIVSKENTIRICKLFNKNSLYFKIFVASDKNFKNSICNNFTFVYKSNKKILFDIDSFEVYKYLD
jgi:hypothetical protein